MAAACNFTAAALHIAIIFGGERWYRFFGAGEQFAQAAARGELWQHAITAGIAAVLAVWGGCALAGAGLLPVFPGLRYLLLLIALVYLLRGCAIFAPLFAPHLASAFLVWSSLICLLFAAAHGWGLMQVWTRLP